MKNRGQMILYGAAIFAAFILVFVFLTRIHPMVVFDCDDWIGLSTMRWPLPVWGAWNPTRVLPEILMPIIGYIGAYFVYPILGDYLTAMTYSYAFVVAVMFTILCCLLHHFLVVKLNLTSWQAVLLVGIFITAHFGLFKSKSEGNSYMLWANDLSCYYYYVVPSLLNSSLVLYFISKTQDLQEDFFQKSVLRRILIITAIYFSIYSNLFPSLILAVYFGVLLLYKLVVYKKNIKDNILAFIKSNSLYSGTIFFWLLGCIFEANGGRSAVLGKAHGLLPKQALVSFVNLLKEINHAYLLFIFLSITLAIIIYKFQDYNLTVGGNFRQDLLLCGISGITVTIGLLLVSAKSIPSYAGTTSSMYGVFFYSLLFIMISFAYVLKNTSLVQYLLPLIAICLLMTALNSERALLDSNYENHVPSECIAVSNDFIRQIRTADQKGLREMTLVVPKGKIHDGWPHPEMMGPVIARTLYAHGLIAHKIQITIKHDLEMNRKYYLDKI